MSSGGDATTATGCCDTGVAVGSGWGDGSRRTLGAGFRLVTVAVGGTEVAVAVGDDVLVGGGVAAGFATRLVGDGIVSG